MNAWMNFLALMPMCFGFPDGLEEPLDFRFLDEYHAQQREKAQASETSPKEVQFSAGLTSDPNTFLLGFELPCFLTDHVTVGPLLQMGVTDDRTLIAPSLNFRYWIDLKDEQVRELHPYLQAGFGLVYLNEDGRAGADNDVGMLFNFGFGGEVELRHGISLGSSILFNVMPQDTLGEHSFFTWQVLTVSFRY